MRFRLENQRDRIHDEIGLYLKEKSRSSILYAGPIPTQTKETIPMRREQYEKGMAVRRAVLGDDYVDKAMASATDFTKPLQDLVTENCWGEIWTREVLPKKTRSLVTIAMLAALKAPAEIKLHVRGALRNGCTVEEIQDVLLQATVYCGVPAGIDAFRAAKEVIDDWTA
jgi:4-carboxymuconolactone decarboxylase